MDALDTRLARFEESFMDFRDAFHRHCHDDEQRETKVMVELAKVGTELAGAREDIRKMDSRQWEASSSVTNTPTGKRPSHHPELKQGLTTGALVAVVAGLVEVIRALVTPAPPQPPTAAQVAAEVRQMLAKQ